MQDRFRFRVLYKDLYSTKPNPIMIYDAEKTYDFLCGNPVSVPASSFHEIFDNDNFIPMQCTGIKGKNGKLIYEGDVVMYAYKYKGYVYWEEDDASFYIRDICSGEVYPLTLYDVKIIGNIHQNKKLLEK